MYSSFQLWPQEEGLSENSESRLITTAISKDFKIFLRWAVNDKYAWKNGNEYGYNIERLTIRRNGELLDNAEYKLITNTPIKPKPLPEWETIINNNDMAAVAAQAIYGESFVTDDENKNAIIKIIDQSGELNRRFAFALYALDQDFEAACFAGLGYIDEDVKPNEEYFYKVISAIPDSILKIENTGVTVKPIKQRKLPLPYDLAGYYYNDAFVLIWEYSDLAQFYNSYFLERSSDGLNFSAVNSVPITKLSSEEISGISYTDSIPSYEKKYYYRVRGKTFFNEISKPSDTVSIIAYKKLLTVPLVEDINIISDKKVKFNWTFDSSEAWKIDKFEILRGDKVMGPYNLVGEDLPPEQRSFEYNNLNNINYFKVRAYGIGGDFQESTPNMVQPIDSIPPAQPKGIMGNIDTLGIVTVSWDKNIELDLKGYAVFRANRPNQEFTRLNKQEFTITNFTDTVNLKGFNKKVYYQIAALDNRYNESVHSEILELERPLMAQPVSPLIKDYEVSKDYVGLKWLNSSSENVASHRVYRKQILEDSNVLWENVYETSDTNTTSFLDQKINENTKYSYTVVAVGTNEKESEPSPPISVITYKNLVKEGIKGLYANADRENKFIQLSWRKPVKDIAELQLFRKVGKENDFQLYQILAKSKNRFLDSKIKVNTIYTYAIKAIFNDGSISEWEEVEVIY